MDDKELIEKCRLYGKNARRWRREFGFLLPLVFERKLYLRCGCASIYEFSSKFCGVGHDITSKILRIYLKLKKYPNVWQEFRRYGWSKLEVIASVIEEKDEEYWLKVLVLPKSALSKLVQGLRKNSAGGENPKFKKLSLTIDKETEFLLIKFKKTLEKEKKRTVTMNELLKHLLRQRKAVLKQNRIPQKKRLSIIQKTNGKCNNCEKPFEEFHHRDRYALTGVHDNIVPLCKDCHKIEHVVSSLNKLQESIDLKVQKYWQRE